MKSKIKNHGGLPHQQAGFTIVEMLVYMGVSAFLLVSLSQIFALVGKLRLESQSSSTLQEDGTYLLSRLSYDIARSDSFTVPVENELRLVIGGNTYRYYVDSNRLKLSVTGLPGSDSVTAKDVNISDLKFLKLSGVTYDNVHISFTLTSAVNQMSGHESRKFITTIGNR